MSPPAKIIIKRTNAHIISLDFFLLLLQHKPLYVLDGIAVSVILVNIVTAQHVQEETGLAEGSSWLILRIRPALGAETQTEQPLEEPDEGIVQEYVEEDDPTEDKSKGDIVDTTEEVGQILVAGGWQRQ